MRFCYGRNGNDVDVCVGADLTELSDKHLHLICHVSVAEVSETVRAEHYEDALRLHFLRLAYRRISAVFLCERAVGIEPYLREYLTFGEVAVIHKSGVYRVADEVVVREERLVVDILFYRGSRVFFGFLRFGCLLLGSFCIFLGLGLFLGSRLRLNGIGGDDGGNYRRSFVRLIHIRHVGRFELAGHIKIYQRHECDQHRNDSYIQNDDSQ